MSSFNINGPSPNKPSVQSSQNLGKDGGGGNTGFMNMRGGKKKKSSSNNEEDNSVFLEEEIHDTFEKQGNKPANKKSGKFMNAISSFIKEKQNDKDTFLKQKEEIEKEPVEEDFSEYNVTLNKAQDPFEDDEYEVADNDDYYNDINV